MKEKTIIIGKPNTSKTIKILYYLRIILIIFLILMIIFLNSAFCLLIGFPFCLALFLYVLFLVIYICYSKTSITVTDKRIYGTAIWGKRIDLPLDSVSAVGIGKFYKGIAVTTSSGYIKFAAIENFEEVYSEISKLLVQRQDRSNASATIIDQVQKESAVDELKKYKELLDSGILTREEFDAKKKQILDL